MDQAQSLREYMLRFNDKKEQKAGTRVITITSGKGGVGKSNFTLNFAIALKDAGKKVVVIDLDLSTANINILMGVTPRYGLVDVISQRKLIWDVVAKGTGGIEYISGGVDFQDLVEIDQSKLSFFWSQIQGLQNYADFILLDTGAGISKELIDFIVASDETIIVTTPEPTAIADSYAVLKAVHRNSKIIPKFRLVVNRAQNYREAAETSRNLQNASSSFLKIGLRSLGFLLEDEHVRQSVRSQMPFIINYPNCSASKSIRQMVYSYLPELKDTATVAPKGIRGFFEKIFSFGKSS